MQNAKYNATHGNRLKILTVKQILERLPVPPTEVKAGYTCEN